MVRPRRVEDDDGARGEALRRRHPLGPVRVGDLLVTSDVEGLAMKSESILVGGRPMHLPGTLIGKALEPLEKGVGEILVLLSLQ